MLVAPATGMLPKRPRLESSCYTGVQCYFLTFCTDYRHAAFSDAAITTLVTSQFLRAYVFMPDHAHALVEGTDAASDFESFCHHAKQLTSYAYKQKVGRRLWQPSYYDRVLRGEDGTWDVVAYIVQNPVRRGLVERWQDYPFTGSGVMTKEALAEELAVHPVKAWQP